MRETTFCGAICAIAVVGCFDTYGEMREPVTFATVNVGLAPVDVSYTDERAPLAIDALASLDTDVLCVQELWRDSDYEALVAAASEAFPHAQRRPAMPAGTGCGADELGAIGACADTHCADYSGEELANCSLEHCSGELGAASGSCVNCLLGVVGAGGDIPTIRAECGGDGTQGFLFDGAFDTALLTRLPVLEQNALVLDSFLVRASVEHARVETPVGPVDVFCTHLASAISDFTYDGEHGDWEGEQAHQITQLLRFVEERTDVNGAGAVILGDLNTGPAIPEAGIEPVWESHYDRVIAAGFEDPHADSPEVQCTACPDNTFHLGSRPKLIDHVLVRGLDTRRATIERFFTEPVNVPTAEGSIESHLSDHYGVRLTL